MSEPLSHIIIFLCSFACDSTFVSFIVVSFLLSLPTRPSPLPPSVLQVFYALASAALKRIKAVRSC